MLATFFAASWRIFAAPTELFAAPRPIIFCPSAVAKSDGFIPLQFFCPSTVVKSDINLTILSTNLENAAPPLAGLAGPVVTPLDGGRGGSKFADQDPKATF